MTPEYINSHEPIYNYLLRYFLPDLSDPYFRQAVTQEIEQDERMTYCRYMAAWLPHESHYNEILNKLKQLCESDRKAVCFVESKTTGSAGGGQSFSVPPKKELLL